MSTRPTTPDLGRVPTELQFQALHAQLERVRAMQHRYNDLFYKLIFLAVPALALMAALSMTETFRSVVLLIPFFVIWVGVQSAYFLTYVVLARVYATGLEQSLNDLLGGDALIAHRLEATYLFPLGGPQFAGVPLRADQTFIGFIAIHFWLLGAAAIALACYRAWQLLPLAERDFPPASFYFPALIAWSLLHLVYLAWYFGTRYHERRIMQLVRDAYGTSYDNA
ncbi:MAG: hypothetical protein M3416_15570 [Acidobacteriota bacterium]|nr:hypothetical protein [Acidobacteriota bacterium]